MDVTLCYAPGEVTENCHKIVWKHQLFLLLEDKSHNMNIWLQVLKLRHGRKFPRSTMPFEII